MQTPTLSVLLLPPQGLDVLFMETAMQVGGSRSHAVMEVIPISEKQLNKAPGMFKKALQVCGGGGEGAEGGVDVCRHDTWAGARPLSAWHMGWYQTPKCVRREGGVRSDLLLV